MKPSVERVLVAVLVVFLHAAHPYAQSATSAITGIVMDSAAGVVPGATVVVRSNATEGSS